MEKRIVFNVDDSNILYSFSNYLSSEIKSIAVNRDIVSYALAQIDLQVTA